MPELPAHLATGRGRMPGPVAGGYVVFDIGAFSMVIAQTDAVVYTMRMPADFRVVSLQWTASAAAVDEAAFSVAQNATADATTPTLLTTAEIDHFVDQNGYADATTDGDAQLSAVAGARNIARGDFLVVFYTTDGSGVSTNTRIQVIGYYTGHVHDSPEND